MQQKRARFIQRHNLSTTWSTINPILQKGELGFESDTGSLKIGDGYTHWNNLPRITSVQNQYQLYTAGNGLVLDTKTNTLSATLDYDIIYYRQDLWYIQAFSRTIFNSSIQCVKADTDPRIATLIHSFIPLGSVSAISNSIAVNLDNTLFTAVQFQSKNDQIFTSLQSFFASNINLISINDFEQALSQIHFISASILNIKNNQQVTNTQLIFTSQLFCNVQSIINLLLLSQLNFIPIAHIISIKNNVLTSSVYTFNSTLSIRLNQFESIYNTTTDFLFTELIGYMSTLTIAELYPSLQNLNIILSAVMNALHWDDTIIDNGLYFNIQAILTNINAEYSTNLLLDFNQIAFLSSQKNELITFNTILFSSNALLTTTQQQILNLATLSYHSATELNITYFPIKTQLDLQFSTAINLNTEFTDLSVLLNILFITGNINLNCINNPLPVTQISHHLISNDFLLVTSDILSSVQLNIASLTSLNLLDIAPTQNLSNKLVQCVSGYACITNNQLEIHKTQIDLSFEASASFLVFVEPWQSANLLIIKQTNYALQQGDYLLLR